MRIEINTSAVEAEILVSDDADVAHVVFSAKSSDDVALADVMNSCFKMFTGGREFYVRRSPEVAETNAVEDASFRAGFRVSVDVSGGTEVKYRQASSREWHDMKQSWPT